ncbi:Aatf-like isoform X1 [Olea europaea subsp. europaea]|uniref:Aatf-like isoform X1 n=2 Tax=Olea europaea subsp. europaea TaxID=158383 RepID=A0A8S0PFT9_OLEEU|nr:Aatf-like isoform X1 [Olea europaea subsp. europaea]
MGKPSKKKLRKVEQSDSGSDFDSYMENQMLPDSINNFKEDKDDYSNDYDNNEKDEDNNDADFGHWNHDEDTDVESEKEGDDDDDEDDEDEEEEGEGSENDNDNEQKGAEMEELEKEYRKLRNEEQDLLRNLKGHKDEDIQKGQAVKNQRALWDKTLEFRFLLQKAFSSSNRLPQEPVRSLFSDSDNGVSEAYSDLITSSKNTLDSILELQQVLVENNPSIAQSIDANPVKDSQQSVASGNLNGDVDEEWLNISQMHMRMTSFRNKSIDKWQRKTQVTTGAAAIKGKLHAFNQNISEQVAAYMRDPSKMIKGMQQNRLAVAVFGNGPASTNTATQGDTNADPELLDDSDFYQQLLKEFFETIDPASSESAFYAMKRLQTKKRKIVDRRASKSRKIRYHVHEKIVNFMAPRPMNLSPDASMIFQNLFGLRTQKSASAV